MKGRLDRTLLLFLALSVFAWMPLASPGYVFHAHDAHHSVMYLTQFDQNIRDGVFWPRWSPDHAKGFGYPFWIFYAPLSYYVAEVFHLVGFGYTASIKITSLLAFLVGGVAMYALARRWWGTGAALVAALAYTYAPYRLVDIYVRNVFAEFFAFAVLPLALLAFWYLAEHPDRRRTILAAVAYALVILSHSAILFLFSLLLGLYLPFLLWRHGRGGRFWQTAGYLALALALALGLTAIFWMPLLAEAGNIVQEQWAHDNYLYFRQFVYPHQFLSPLWGFGFAVEGPDDGMAFQVGAATLVLAMFAAVAAWQRRVAQRSLVAFLTAATLLVLLCITPAARFLWDLVPQVGYTIQFPWRALTLTTLTLALLAGAAVATRADGEAEPSLSPPVMVIALLVTLASFSYTQAQLTPITPRDDSVLAIVDFERRYPDQLGSTVWGVPPTEDSSLIPQYEAGIVLNKGVILAGQGTVEAVHHGGASDILRVRAATPVRLLVQTYWYPGWRAWVDGQPVEIAREGPHALIALDVPAGEHIVTLRFTKTPLRRVATLVSLATLAGMAVVPLVGRYVRGHSRQAADILALFLP